MADSLEGKLLQRNSQMNHTIKTKNDIPYICPLQIVADTYRFGRAMQFYDNPNEYKFSPTFNLAFSEIFASYPTRTHSEFKHELRIILSKITRMDPQPLSSADQSEQFFKFSKKLHEAAIIAKEFSNTEYERLLLKSDMYRILSRNIDPKLRRPIANTAHRTLAVYLMHWCRQGKLPLKPAISNSSRLGKLFQACCKQLKLGISKNSAYYLSYARDVCLLAEKNEEEFGADWKKLSELAARAVAGRRLPSFYPPLLVHFAGHVSADTLIKTMKELGLELTDENKMRHETALQVLTTYHFDQQMRAFWDGTR